MINTVYGYKKSNTQTWDKTGKRTPVTVATMPKMIVTQIKTQDKDGYTALQLGVGEKRSRKQVKPMVGHLKKAGVEQQFLNIKEIRTDVSDEVTLGTELDATEILEPGDIVKVSAFTKGTGFTGVMKRWNFSGGPRTHGQSDRERAPGSIGQGTTPGRVWKGKKMAGRDGHLQVTQENLMIIKVDAENGEVWLNGTTPGHKQSLLKITKTGHKDISALFETSKTEVSETSEDTTEVAQ